MRIESVRWFLAAAAGVLLLSSSAYVKDQEQPQVAQVDKPAFHKMDTNGDQKLSSAELQAHAETRFDKSDPNGDGRLTWEEDIVNGEARFAEIDVSGDGYISIEEHVGAWTGAFAKKPSSTTAAAPPTGKEPASLRERMDADGDGQVDIDEAAAHRRSHFQESDADADGKLNKAEFAAFREKAFRQMDTGGDGVVTKEEYVFFWTEKKVEAATENPAPKPAE